MFPKGTQPVAGRWRATTGLQFNKRMHPGRACQGRTKLWTARKPNGSPKTC